MKSKLSILFIASIAFSLIFPPLHIGSYFIRVEDVLLFGALYWLTFSFHDFYRSKIFITTLLFSILLFFSMFISNNLGLYYYSTGINFPTEYIQIIKRFGYFLVFFIAARKKILNSAQFQKIYRYIFLVALVFGVIQSTRIGFISDFLTNLYGRTEQQIEGVAKDNFRLIGIAGHSIAWGGLSLFIFYFFKFFEKSRYIRMIGLFLALYNIFYSGSRAAIIALFCSFLFLPLINFYLKDNSIRKLARNYLQNLSLIIGGISFFLIFFFQRAIFIIYRFSFIFGGQTPGGGTPATDRKYQISTGFSLIKEDYLNLLFGIGKPWLYHNLPYLEVEPVYYFVTYGIFGFLLHYTFLFLIVRWTLKYANSDYQTSGFIIITLFSYLMFSLGYFFYRELIVGLPFWIFAGFFLGKAVNTSAREVDNIKY